MAEGPKRNARTPVWIRTIIWGRRVANLFPLILRFQIKSISAGVISFRKVVLDKRDPVVKQSGSGPSSSIQCLEIHSDFSPSHVFASLVSVIKTAVYTKVYNLCIPEWVPLTQDVENLQLCSAVLREVGLGSCLSDISSELLLCTPHSWILKHELSLL